MVAIIFKWERVFLGNEGGVAGPIIKSVPEVDMVGMVTKRWRYNWQVHKSNF